MNASRPIGSSNSSLRWPSDMLRVYPDDAYYLFLFRLIEELTRNVQAPKALIGLSVLSTIAMVLQGLFDVLLPTGHISPLSMFTAGIASSGERKSAIERLLARPIHSFDERQLAQHAVDKANFEFELRKWKAENRRLAREIDRLQPGNERDSLILEQIQQVRVQPIAPRRRHLILENVTAASFMEAVDGDGECVAFHTPEGGTFLNGGAMELMEMLNKGWDGANLTFDRAHGRNLFARRPRVSISMMVQEAVLMMSIAKRGNLFRHSGHAARYLFANPASTQGFRVQYSADQEWKYLPEFHGRLQEFLAMLEAKRREGNFEHEVLTFGEDAAHLWREKSNEIECLLREGAAWYEIRDFASKALEHTGRVAALLHKFCKQEGAISAETFSRAWQIIHWHAEEFRRIFTVQTAEMQFVADVETLTRYLHQTFFLGGMQCVPKNVVLKAGPLRPVGRLTPVLDWMASQDQIRLATIRPRAPVLIWFNPEFFGRLGGPPTYGSSGLFS